MKRAKKLEGVWEYSPGKSLMPGSSNWLKTTLILFLKYKLTLQVNLALDVRMALVWCRTSLIVCIYPKGLPRLMKGRN